MPYTGSAATELILLPVLKAHKATSGRLIVTQKYLNGATEYAKSWPGPVTSLFDVSSSASTDLDHVEFAGDVGGHIIEIRPRDSEVLARRLQSASLVVGFLSPFEVATTELCNFIGVPVIHVSEYTLRTEWQIIDASGANTILKLRRKLWAWKAERLRRYLIGISAGLQCNGVPTYRTYREMCSDALLFFDNRVKQSDIITSERLARKADEIRVGKPLRLVFGGRFVPMKGVLQLPEVARHLRQAGVPFELSIYGAGPEESKLRGAISRYALEDQVSIFPPIDFDEGWIPFLKQAADLFVCCHMQGDPSSTYSEVMACGVPVAGYDNEALKGIVELSGSGFLAPMGASKILASVIADLHRDRNLLIKAAQIGRSFSMQHCFEATFSRRVDHFKERSRHRSASAWV
jgi:colanic acid/amylovoran biosynthesis glycosyltransferase